MLLGCLENFLGGNHHPEVHDLEAVALEHHADNVLSDVVNITFHCRHDDHAMLLADISRGLFFFFDEGYEMCDGFFHDAG
ncbi:MAG: Uncharacterised protein [Gammaproteobacteria bacterium]|nr:MAG: Uncharacterised protein [Gammaproteobacteria bacterium]